jgi:pyrimidine-specific ribonucleoside hydrolase
VELLRDVLVAAADAGEPVTLVPLAPLTNVALLLRTYPEAARGLRRIVFMGGAALVGNVTAAAEFNVFHDPESAAAVLDAATSAGVEVTMYGLDVFYDVRVTRAEAAGLAAAADPVSRLSGRLIGFQCDRFEAEDATIGDAGAVCAVIAPGGLGVRRLPVRVELTGAFTRGQTVVDQRTWASAAMLDPHAIAPAAVLDVALSVDAEAYRRLWLAAVGDVGPTP